MMEEEDDDDGEAANSSDDSIHMAFEDFPASTLLISHRLVDDLFCGLSSKDIYTRSEGEEDKGFTFLEEVSLYLVHHVKPRLEELFNLHRNRRLYIYLATEIQYYLLKDPEEICSRWSSLRNQHFVAPDTLSDEERHRWINSLCQLFVEETEGDVEDMQDLQGSSWIYSSIRQFHLRHVVAQPSNVLSFGAY